MAEIAVPVYLVLTVKDVSVQMERELKKAGKISPISKDSMKKSGESFAAGVKSPFTRVIHDALRSVRYMRFYPVIRELFGVGQLEKDFHAVGKKGAKVAGGAGSTGGMAGGMTGVAVLAVAIVGMTVILNGIMEIFSGFMSVFKSFFGLMKMIGKLIGMMVFPFIAIFMPLFVMLARFLTPVAKILMMVLRPIYKRIMETLKASAGASPIEAGLAVLGATIVGFVELLALSIIMGFGIVLKNILIPAIGFFVKLILIVLGGIALTIAKLVSFLSGGVINVEGAIASAVAGAVGAVGLAEVELTTAIQIQMDSLLNSFVATGSAADTASSALSGFDSILVAIASGFDSRFGLLMEGVLTIVDNYRTQAETLAGDAILTTTEKLTLLYGLYSSTADSITTYINSVAPFWSAGFEAMKTASDVALPAILSAMDTYLFSMLLSTDSYGNLMKDNWNSAVESLYKYTKDTKDKIDALLKEAKKAKEPVGEVGAKRPGILSYIATGALLGGAGGSLFGGVGAIPGAIGGGLIGGIGGMIVGAPMRDFIMRPGQNAASFSPSDTIVGMKDTSKLGGSSEVNIQNINVYSNATNTKDLVKDISKELLYNLRNRSAYGY